jgi:Predicted metal-dependent hydrolase of the TIM-barrel fold
MIIDFHTHTFPEKIATKAISKLETMSNLKAASDGTNKGLEKSMDKAGIRLSLLLPIAQKPEQTHNVNDCAIENDRLQGFRSFGSVHPQCSDWENELLRIKQAGLIGIKLHPDFQGIDLNDPRMVAVMAKASELGLWITIHSGMDYSFPNIHRSTPKMMAEILPELRGGHIVCAHSGGFLYLDDVEKLLLNKEEIYIDTSFSIGVKGMDSRQLERIYRGINPEHIFFGTDSPWYDQKKAVLELLDFPIPDNLKEKILFGNAQNVLLTSSLFENQK